MAAVQLREVNRNDVHKFFEHQLDPDANSMAAFTSKDPSNMDAFMAKWDKILSDDLITKRTIVAESKIVGHVLVYVHERLQRPEITYWLAKSSWGNGVATSAANKFLKLFPERPIYARAATDNLASIRVLKKCGFEIVGQDKGFANARGLIVDEVVLVKQIESLVVL